MEQTGYIYEDSANGIALLNAEVTTSSKKIKGLYQEYNFAAEAVEDATDVYMRAVKSGNEMLIEDAKAQLDEITATAKDVQTTFMSELSSFLDQVNDAVATSAALIAHDFSEALGGVFDDLDNAMDVYTQKKTIDEYFLDPTNKAFALDEMVREINKAMEDVTDPAILAKYQTWLDKVNAARADGVSLTQTQVDILKAEFELEKLRDQYQDARAAKNTMRLARDASGNWSYIYSSDSGDDEDAEAEIQEKINNIYNMHKEAADEASEAWLQLQVDYDDYIQAIDWIQYEHDEKYKQEVDQRIKWYQEQSNLYAQTVEYHNAAIGRSFDQTTLGVITDMDTMEAANNAYLKNHSDMTDALHKNYLEWQEVVEDVCAAIEMDVDDLEDIIASETKKIINENKVVEASFKSLNTEAKSAMNDLYLYEVEWVQMWVNTIQPAIDKTKELIETISGIEKQYAGSSDAVYANKLSEMYYMYEDLKNLSATRTLGAQEQAMYDALTQANIAKNTGEDTSYYNSTEWLEYMRAYAQAAGYQLVATADGYKYMRTTGFYIQAFGSGGLATDPGLAVIGEAGKELVLNPSDTENILAAVAMIREFVQGSFGANVQSLTSALSNLQPAAGDTTNATTNHVVIKADFPNVTAREEIEAAFNNLLNRAQQYNVG